MILSLWSEVLFICLDIITDPPSPEAFVYMGVSTDIYHIRNENKHLKIYLNLLKNSNNSLYKIF